MKILVWEVRTSKGFTLMELSKKSGIGKSTINNIENGKVCRINRGCAGENTRPFALYEKSDGS